MLNAASSKFPLFPPIWPELFSAFRQFCSLRLGKYRRARDRRIRARLAQEEKLGVADNDEHWAKSLASDWGTNEAWGTGEGWGSGKWCSDTTEGMQCGRDQGERQNMIHRINPVLRTARGNFTCGLVGRGVDTEGIGRGVKGVGPGNFIPALLDCAWWGVDGEGVRCGVDGLGRDDNKVPWDADTGEGDGRGPAVEDKGKLIPKWRFCRRRHRAWDSQRDECRTACVVKHVAAVIPDFDCSLPGLHDPPASICLRARALQKPFRDPRGKHSKKYPLAGEDPADSPIDFVSSDLLHFKFVAHELLFLRLELPDHVHSCKLQAATPAERAKMVDQLFPNKLAPYQKTDLTEEQAEDVPELLDNFDTTATLLLRVFKDSNGEGVECSWAALQLPKVKL
ncbi:hypothetical protein B0H14DRAFT_2620950 [Mycena olivaceomarginata]|nr:hypothetical protein B0H14DRAFT_2620950 [Mycena olivaceomarginata]